MVWRVSAKGENLFKNLTHGITPIYTSFFMESGLRLPHEPLLVDFLRDTHLHIGQLATNTVRVILGVAKMNMRFNILMSCTWR